MHPVYPPLHFRFITAAEEALLQPFLMLAAHEENEEIVRHHPQIALYAREWGRRGDTGIIARDANGASVGAA